MKYALSYRHRWQREIEHTDWLEMTASACKVAFVVGCLLWLAINVVVQDNQTPSSGALNEHQEASLNDTKDTKGFF